MVDKKKREMEWAKAKRLCRLNRETVQMAKELCLNPRTLIKNIPSKAQQWKAPVHVWIRDMYEERMDKAARKKTKKQSQQGAKPNKTDETAADDLLVDGSYADPIDSMGPFDDVSIFTDEEAFFEDVRETMEFLRPRRRHPNREDIKDQNQILLDQQKQFRIAAERVAQEMAHLPSVTKVVLFGSVAALLDKEIPRFTEYRRAKVAVWHECEDVDLAVWVSDLTNLRQLQKARSRALNQLQTQRDIDVAHHQVDVFVMDANTGRYLGRLCCYGQCPRGKPDCRALGCGTHKFLKQLEGFTLKEDALSPDRTILLYKAPDSDESDGQFEDIPF